MQKKNKPKYYIIFPSFLLRHVKIYDTLYTILQKF